MIKKIALASLLIIAFLNYGWTKENDAAAKKSTIAGRVVDENGLALPGATVFIKSLNKGTVTNVNGYYHLAFDVMKEIKFELAVSYIGFKDQSQEIVLRNGKSVELNFVMIAGIDINEVVVNGSLQGQAKAINQQKNNLNVSNIISSDQVGRFPDANIGDALKRIPGINVQYDQGEARFGNIRGTAADFSSVTINGDRVPSAEAEVRSVQLDLIPSDMVQTVEVNKVITPDMDADAIGGSVNLVTKNSPYKQRIAGTVGSGYNFLSEKPALAFSLMYGSRFLNDKLGMIIAASYQDMKLGSDNIEAEWDVEDGKETITDFQIRTYSVERERQSYSASFDYIFNPNHKIELKGIYNHRKDWENRYRLRFKNIEEKKGKMIAEIRRQTKGGSKNNNNARLEDQKAMNFSLNGEHHFGSVEFKWKGSYAKASEERPNERYVSYRMKKVQVNPDISNQSKPFINIIDNADAMNLNSEWGLKELTEEFQYTEDEDMKFKADVSFPILDGDYGNKLKVGVRYKGKSKMRDNEFYEYEPKDEDGFNTKALGSIGDQSKSNFLPGKEYQTGKFVTKEHLGKLNLNDTDYKKVELLEELAGNFDAKENVMAGYIRFDQNIGKDLELVTGVRVERTGLEYSGRKLLIDEEGDPNLEKTPVEKDDYINILPSLIAKYSLGNNTKIKFGWTNTIARPKYYDLVPHVEISLEDMEASIGNPDLKPAKSMNFDLMFEHYFSNIGMVSAGVFYKGITDFFVEQELRDFKYLSNTYDKFYKPLNAGDADLLGFETSFQRQFDFLPGSLRQTGFMFNYTYTSSKTKNIILEDRSSDDLPLPGSPEHTLNASLYYEGKKLTVRTSFNYASDFIDEVGDNKDYDRYYDKVTYLDANANYAITRNFNLFFEANNLLNQPLRYYQGTSKRLMQEEFYNVKIFFGLKFNF